MCNLGTNQYREQLKKKITAMRSNINEYVTQSGNATYSNKRKGYWVIPYVERGIIHAHTYTCHFIFYNYSLKFTQARTHTHHFILNNKTYSLQYYFLHTRKLNFQRQ